MDKVMNMIPVSELGSVSKADFEVPDLEFKEASSPSQIPTPDELPDRNLRSELPLELKRSATVEALISQNDDMIARLKVNLRRLALTENENDRLRKIQATLEAQNITLRDELEMAKEKEAILVEKERKMNDVLVEFRERFPEYQGLSEKLDRYKKYHERIKTQVKPFIHQLKGYADSLSHEIRKLSSELAARESEIEMLRRTRIDIEAGLEQMRQDAEDRQCLIVSQYEHQLEVAQSEIKELIAKAARLELRGQSYDETRARESELENIIIAMRRQKDDLQKEAQDREQTLRSELGLIRATAADLTERLNDKNSKTEVLQDENDRLSSQNASLGEQMAGLRVLWENKSKENEELKAKLSALERLNAELSRSFEKR